MERQIDELDQSGLLERELWDLMNEDGGAAIRDMRAIKKREDRRGRMKRLLCDAIERSSLGIFAGKMHHFGGKVYVPIERYAFYKVVFSICNRRLNLPDADLVGMADIYYDCGNTVYSKQLHVSNDVMLFRNGVLDIGRGKFYKRFDPKYVQLWSVDYDYEKGVKTFLWQKFLDEVLPDKYWQDALQMFLGATFIDRAKVKIEHIVILLGKGANGKSVIQQTVCGVLGEEYVSTMEVGRLCSPGLSGDMAVAEINGKRLNYCTEMEETDFYKKSARLKAIVSGENVTARHIYGSPFKAMNVPLLMANANALPFFNKRDDAMLRRLYVIPFNIVIPPERQDRGLGHSLEDEYSGILNWMLEGREKFIKNGYSLPLDLNMRKFMEDSEREYNSVLKYMDVHEYRTKQEGTVVEPVFWVRLSELYADYFRWAKRNAITDVVTRQVFSNVLEDSGFHKERRTQGICFGLFGNVKKRRKQLENRLKNPSRNDVRITWLEGVPYVTSLQALSDYTSVSLHVIRRLYIEGEYAPFIKRFKEKAYYQIPGVVEVLKRRGIMATDDESRARSKMLKGMHKERNQFNSRMAARGLPYRKFASKEPRMEEGIIQVSDFTTDDEALEMARQAGYDVSSIGKLMGHAVHMMDEPEDDLKAIIEKEREYEQQEESEK